MRELDSIDLDRVIEMAWEDRTPFEAIAYQFGLSNPEVIQLMRSEMKASSFRMWRKRVSGRKTKHAAIGRRIASGPVATGSQTKGRTPQPAPSTHSEPKGSTQP